LIENPVPTQTREKLTDLIVNKITANCNPNDILEELKENYKEIPQNSFAIELFKGLFAYFDSGRKIECIFKPYHLINHTLLENEARIWKEYHRLFLEFRKTAKKTMQNLFSIIFAKSFSQKRLTGIGCVAPLIFY